MVLYVTDVESGSYIPFLGVEFGTIRGSAYARPIVLFPKITSAPLAVSLPPMSSHIDIVGDRDCLHHNFKGNILRHNGVVYSSYIERAASSPYPVFDTIKLGRWVDQTLVSYIEGRAVILPFENFSYEMPLFRYGSNWCYQATRYTWYGSFESGSVAVLIQSQFVYTKSNKTTIDLSQYSETMQEWGAFNSFNIPTKRRGYLVFNSTAKEYFWRNRAPADYRPLMQSVAWTNIVSSQYTTGWTPPAQTYEEKKSSAFQLLTNLSTMFENVLSKTDFSDDWQTLCVQSIQSARHVDINTGMLAADIVKLRTALKPLVDLAKGVTPKRLATAYLSWRYGAPLTYQDGRALITEIIDSSKSIVRTKLYSSCRSRLERAWKWESPRSDEGTLRMNYKVYYTPRDDNFSTVVSNLISWDLFPSLANVWDVIPYSFVVDWFVPIQDALERLDSRTFAAVLNVIKVCRSTRIETIVKPITVADFVKYSGWKETYIHANLTYIRYNRENPHVLDRPGFRIGQPSEFRNIAELTSIVVQKL